jgi:hypothetical protein
MTAQQIRKIAILYQLLHMGCFKHLDDAPFIEAMAGKPDDMRLNYEEARRLNSVYLDNEKQAKRLEYWQMV